MSTERQIVHRHSDGTRSRADPTSSGSAKNPILLLYPKQLKLPDGKELKEGCLEGKLLCTLEKVAMAYSKEQKVLQNLVGEVDEALYIKDLNWYTHILNLCPNYHLAIELKKDSNRNIPTS